MSQNIPPITLILPIRNEARYIERCLNAIMAQDYPSDCLEILIADGMSTDGTRDIVETFKQPAQSPVLSESEGAAKGSNVQRFNIKLLDNPEKIVPTGLNVALRQAKGEIIIRVDGHCEIAPDYVSNCVRHLREDGVDCVGGPIQTIGETYKAQTIAIAMSSPFGVGGSPFRTVKDKAMLVDSVAFPAYTRQAIEKAGLFDEELVRNQDDEYNYRLRKLGGRILLSPDIRSRYYSRGSLCSLWCQYFQYGYWKVRVLQKHPRQMRPRQFVPPLFVGALILSFAVEAFNVSTFTIPPLSLILVPYLIANLTASIITSAKRGWRHLPILLLVYATLHLSYGLGFLIGLIRFAHRWGDKQGKVPESV